MGGSTHSKKNQLNKQTTKSYSFCNIISHLRLCLLSPLFFQMPSQDSHSSSSLASCAQFSSPAQHTFLGYITTHLPPHLKKKKKKTTLFFLISISTSHLHFCLHSCFPPSLPLKLESTDGIKLCTVTFSGSVSTQDRLQPFEISI